jgi:hypothetical protein
MIKSDGEIIHQTGAMNERLAPHCSGVLYREIINMKELFKSIDFVGQKGIFKEIHATTTRGKELAILFKNDEIVEVFNLNTEKTEDVKEGMKEELQKKTRLLFVTGEVKEGLREFYNEARKQELKDKESKLYFIKTFLKVPKGANWSLYKWDVLTIEGDKIENVTYMFKYLTYDRQNYELHYGGALKERLRSEGFRIAGEL